MSELEVTCPECGNVETLQLKPPMYIYAEVEISVGDIHCTWCGYEGPYD